MFYDYEIDACPAYGWMGGPTASVRISSLKNNHERRNRTGSLMRHSYTLPFSNIKESAYLEEIKSAFMVFGGPADSFLCKDYWDHTVDQSPIFGVNGSTQEYQLSKRYYVGSGFYDRPITKPISVTPYVAGIPATATFDKATGRLILDEPATAQVTWSGEFRVPVRFADFELIPSIDTSFADGSYAMNGSCQLIEVFGE